jgi:hypothetical protein
LASLVYEQELVSDDTFCGDCDYRVGSHQNVQALFDPQFESELRWRPVRNCDIDDFSRIHACDPHLGAFCDAIEICEFGINIEMACKSLLLIADQEDPEGEERNAGCDEDSDGDVSIRHLVITPQ